MSGIGLSSVCTHSSLEQQALKQLQLGNHVCLHGPAGAGHAWLLHRVQSALERAGIPTALLNAQNMNQEVSSLPEGVSGEGVLLIKGFEHASENLTQNITACINRGGRIMFSCETAVDGVFSDATERCCGSHDALDGVHHIDLNPVAPEVLLEYIHRSATSPVNGVLADTIVRLSHGRRVWTEILLTLTFEGHITTFPHSSLLFDTIPESSREWLRLLEPTTSLLSEEQVAAAVALSEITPLDFTGMGAVVGVDTARALQEARALVTLPDSKRLCVPQLLAASLIDRTTPLDIDAARSRIAQTLTHQELLGLPLNEQDTLFCSRALDLKPQSNNLNPEHSTHVQIMHRALSHLVTFGEVDRARSLMLRLVGLGMQLTGLNQVRTLLAFGNQRAAHLALERLPPDEKQDQQLGRAYYSALLHGDDIEDSSSKGVPEQLFRVANTPGPLIEDISALNADVLEYGSSELTVFAEALTALDAVWLGAVPEHSWLASGAAIPKPPLSSDESVQDLLTATLIAHALTAFLSGEFQYRHGELIGCADRLPTPAYHRVWIEHLAEVSVAMLSGDASRAGVEWELFEGRAPRLIPEALSHRIAVMSDALKFTVDTPNGQPRSVDEQLAMPYRLACYLTGKYHLLQALPIPPTTGKVLPIITLARDHLAALAEQNPAELLRVGDRLRKHAIWTAASAAYSEARRIYLGRRASGNVTKCDNKLASLAEDAAVAVPWLGERLFSAPPPARLTAREREAALLAAQGKTNREIAESLSCHVRTVESHIAQARAKLGAPTRRDLALHLPLLVHTNSGTPDHPTRRAEGLEMRAHTRA